MKDYEKCGFIKLTRVRNKYIINDDALINPLRIGTIEEKNPDNDDFYTQVFIDNCCVIDVKESQQEIINKILRLSGD